MCKNGTGIFLMVAIDAIKKHDSNFSCGKPLRYVIISNSIPELSLIVDQLGIKSMVSIASKSPMLSFDNAVLVFFDSPKSSQSRHQRLLWFGYGHEDWLQILIPLCISSLIGETWPKD